MVPGGDKDLELWLLVSQKEELLESAYCDSGGPRKGWYASLIISHPNSSWKEVPAMTSSSTGSFSLVRPGLVCSHP